MKPTQLLGGRERDLEGNPDFSTKDLTGHQQAPLAPPGPVRAPVAAPCQPVELPPEPPGSASLPSLPPTPTASQVIYGYMCRDWFVYLVVLIICIDTKGSR